MLKDVSCPPCAEVQWFHKTDSLDLFCRPLKCSSPLENMFLLVSPLYSALHSLHIIRYPTFFRRQFPPPSSLHEKHFVFPHVFPVHGSDFDSWDRRVCPPISTILILHFLSSLPLASTSLSLLASVLLGVHGTNSTVEYLSFLYQFCDFFSFCFLRYPNALKLDYDFQMQTLTNIHTRVYIYIYIYIYYVCVGKRNFDARKV